MTLIQCDRCNEAITLDNGLWHKGAGVCENCGDDLCEDCAQGFDENGYCKLCHDEAHQGKHVDEPAELAAVPAMLTVNVHDVLDVKLESKTIKGNDGYFTTIDYDFIGANFTYRVTAFMKGAGNE